jgi:hypothetical protein
MNTQSLGITLILVGSPIIYFIRDGLRVSSGNFFFTGFFLVLFLLLLINYKRFFSFKFIKPNLTLFLPTLVFFIISFVYFLYSNYDNKFKDLFYFTYLFLYFLLLLNIDEYYIKNIHIDFLFITLIVNILFIIYYLFFFTNYREIGERAYIGGEEGNPNLYAFIAYLGIISSYLIYKYRSNYIFKVFSMINLILSAIVIIFAQNRAVLLTLFLILILVLVIKFIKLIRTFKFKKIRISFFELLSSFFILTFLYFLITNLLPVNIYLENYRNYILGGINNIMGGVEEASSQGRIDSFNLILSEINNHPEDYIIGKGYKEQWLDIPILQAFRDLGIIGGMSLLLFHVTMIYLLLKYFKTKNKKPYYDLFVGYYILLFINSFFHGQPYDYSFWLPFLTIIRFFRPDKLINYAQI